MFGTLLYEKSIKNMELVCDTDDKHDISASTIKLVPCRSTGASTATLSELDLLVKENDFAGSVRQARQLLSDPEKIPYVPYGNILFIETRWKSLNGELWVPYLTMLYFPNLKRSKWILSLINIPNIPKDLWIGHNHHYFAQVD